MRRKTKREGAKRYRNHLNETKGSLHARNLSVRIADKNELVQQLAVGRSLRHNFPVDEKELLERLVVDGHHEADDGLLTHVRAWKIEHDHALTMRSVGNFSPFSVSMITFFSASIFSSSLPFSEIKELSMLEKVDLKFGPVTKSRITGFQQAPTEGLLELLLGRHVKLVGVADQRVARPLTHLRN